MDYSIHISLGHANSEWIGDGISGKHFSEVSLYSMHSKHGANTTIQSRRVCVHGVDIHRDQRSRGDEEIVC